MEPPSSAPPELPVPVDTAAEQVLQVAAWYGSEARGDVFISYTTLLLGLLYAPIGNASPWQDAAHRVLRVEAIKSSRPGLARIEDRRVHGASGIDPRDGNWPSGQQLISISAGNVLTEALRRAQKHGGPRAVVAPGDIMASFLFAIPTAHRQQAEQWGFAEAASLLGPMLPGHVPDTSASSGDLPGYDTEASIVLRVAFVLARRRKEAKRALLRSSGLLIALAESAPLLGDRDAASLVMLRGMLGADPGYATKRDAAFDIPPDLAAAAAAAGSDFPPLSDNVGPILRDAARLVTRTRRRPDVGVRHLLGALVALPDGADRNSNARTILQQAGVDTDELREALMRIIRDRHPWDNLQAWHDVLIGSAVPMIATARPDTIPDDPRSEDTLDLRRYGDAIGALIAARNQKPPLSIAVFGPWGSGKSFFMAMIRAAVRDFEKAGKAAAQAKEETPFLGRIVQIEFNAWHYADGNLWASLVHAILVGLQDVLKPTAAASPFQEMLDQLQLRQAARLEAEARLREAEQRRDEAKAAMRQADQQLASRRGDEGNVPSAEEVLRAVRDEALATIAPSGGSTDAEAWIRSLGDSVARAAEYLGRPGLAQQVPVLVGAGTGAAEATAALQVRIGALSELLDEAHTGATRGLGLLGWLANARVAKKRLVLWALLAGIALVGVIALVQEIERRGSDIAATMAAATALIAAVSGGLASCIAWAKRHMAHASRAIAVLGSVRDRVEARQAQRVSERDAALLAARRATSEAEAEAARRRADYEAAAAAVAQAEQDLHAATSAERLKRFVAQRLAQGDYQRHLGLIHTIRADLEQLRGILEKVHPQERAHGAEAPVERIVLYIDDLDRCPPARVVEVLEAVHLLLAFPLFVVVVGVDVRWVAQALHERYPKQLGEGPGIASPIDYLEKVFQIPFWLPAMDSVAGRRLLESSVGPAQPEALTTSPSRRALTPGSQTGLPSEADMPADEADTTVAEGGDSGPAQPSVPPVEPRAVAEALVLGRREREQLLTMAGAIGASPRRAKRFANLYRLLKASLSPAERRGFALDGGRTGSYTAALFLLALSTGAPRATAALIAPLLAPPGASPDAYLDAAIAAADAAAAPEEVAAVRAASTMLRDVADRAGLAKDLHFWASRVTRFNFDGRAPQARKPAPEEEEPPPEPVPAAAKAARRKPKPAR